MLKMNINIVLVMCLYIIRWFNYVPMRVKSENLFFIYGHSCSPTYPLFFENHKSLLQVCCTLSME